MLTGTLGLACGLEMTSRVASWGSLSHRSHFLGQTFCTPRDGCGQEAVMSRKNMAMGNLVSLLRSFSSRPIPKASPGLAHKNLVGIHGLEAAVRDGSPTVPCGLFVERP